MMLNKLEDKESHWQTKPDKSNATEKEWKYSNDGTTFK